MKNLQFLQIIQHSTNLRIKMPSEDYFIQKILYLLFKILEVYNPMSYKSTARY